MNLYCNGFWSGFVEETDGVHVGVFKRLFSSLFSKPITCTKKLEEADILLESHFAPSILHTKSWTYSFFFSGEASIPLPTHASEYTLVLGAQVSPGNFVPLLLGVCYDLCKPCLLYEQKAVPPKDICCIVSSPVTTNRYRYKFLEQLEAAGLHVDMWGHYKNNMGKAIEGSYFEEPILELQKTYKIVLALENTEVDTYITEKIINPLRAGVIPVYFGSSRIDEYIHASRIVQVKPESVDQTIEEIKKLCTDETAWMEKVRTPCFVKTSEELFQKTIEGCRICLSTKPYEVSLIGNTSIETERNGTLAPITTFYSIQPSCEVYGEAAYQHPLYTQFNPTKKINAISLAINHIAILQQMKYTNKFVVIFESDAIPLFDMKTIHEEIQKDIEDMKIYNIDFAFLGKGCCVPPESKEMLGEHLYARPYSRCTEAYIASPKGILHFLDWFYARKNHNVIDWAFNEYFQENPDRKGSWRTPELFQQGSICGYYGSRVPI